MIELSWPAAWFTVPDIPADQFHDHVVAEALTAVETSTIAPPATAFLSCMYVS
jgi:hypothetical protein